jgi:hypothetical protein
MRRASALGGCGARALACAGFGVLALTATACESTEQQSAKIGREGSKLVAAQGPVRVAHVNRAVRVSHVTLLEGNGRTAVALQLTGTSKTNQTNVPVLISLVGAGGKVLYSNDTAGLESSLQQMPLLRPGQGEWWVDDQVLAAQKGGHVQVKVGTSSHARASGRARPAPQITTSGVQVGEEGGMSVLTGQLVNHSSSTQHHVPVFAVAVKGQQVTAAGRALIASLAPGSQSFQIFLVGHPTGSSIQLTVTPTTA